MSWINDPGTENFSFSANVGVNDSIAFIVGVNTFAGYGWGTTPIVATITSDLVLPLPAALPLFMTGAGIIGLLGWRRKRKNAAALAA